MKIDNEVTVKVGPVVSKYAGTLHDQGDHTRVVVDTDLIISGKIAQLGGGMIKQVSTKLLGQFVTCLEGKVAVPVAVAEPVSVPLTPGTFTPTAADETQPLDLMALAGKSVTKRLLPVGIGLLVLIAVVVFLVTR